MVLPLIIHRVLEQADASQVGDETSLKPSVPGQQQLEKHVPHQPLLCTKEPVDKDADIKSQHKDTVERVTPVPKHDERKTESEPVEKKNGSETIGTILESDLINNCVATSPHIAAIVEEITAKSSPLRKVESQLLIIGELTVLPPAAWQN